MTTQHERVELRMAEQPDQMEYRSKTSLLLDDIAQLLMELLAETKQIRAALAASGSLSSVQIEQGAKDIRLTVKAYETSDVSSAGTAALEEFARLHFEVERRQMSGWTA